MMDEGYRIEVRQRATGSPAFRWEIYRDAKEKPVAASFNLFRSSQAAQAAEPRNEAVRARATRPLSSVNVLSVIGYRPYRTRS